MYSFIFYLFIIFPYLFIYFLNYESKITHLPETLENTEQGYI